MPARVEHFANRIALLTALAARRRARTRARTVEPETDSFADVAADVDTGEHASPLATTVAARRRMLVRQLLDELPDVIAEALASHFILGYTVDEIAAASSVPANALPSIVQSPPCSAINRLMTVCSVTESSADVASSSRRIEALRQIARAIPTR